MLRRLKSAFLILVITLLLLESALQLIALCTWLLTTTGDEKASADKTILCIGDSYTYGLGATSRQASYPGKLDALLKQELGDRWAAVNKGYPGQTSRDVLRRLDGQLVEIRPSVVCLIVGINDHILRPEELLLGNPADQPHDQGAPFRFECRTLRLISIFLASDSTENSPANTADPAADPADQSSLAGERGRGQALMNEGCFAESEAILTACLARAESTDTAVLRMDLATLYGRWGKPVQAREQCNSLRKIYEDEPSANIAEALLLGLIGSGHDDEAFALEKRLVEQFPDNSTFSLYLADHLSRHVNIATAITEIDRTIGLLASDTDDEHIAYVWRRRAEMYIGVDPLESLKSLIRSHSHSPEVAVARGLIILHADKFTPKMLDQAISATAARPSIISEFKRFLDDTLSDSSADQVRILRSHIQQILERTRSAGAELIMASYPRPNPDRTQFRIAQELGIPWVQISNAFEAALRTDPNRELFIPDDHPNDAGYALMARELSRFLLQRLKR